MHTASHCILRTCTYNKTNVCRSKFRPALDVPTHNAAEVTEREAGLAVALWRAAGLGGAPPAGACGCRAPATAPERSETASNDA